MFNLLTAREQIILFFVKYTKNRLNKNCYNINFYKNRKAENVYYLLKDYYKDTPELHTASIAQQYYHIYHNHTNIPVGERFINFSIGYTGLKVKDRSLNFLYTIPDRMLYNVNDTVNGIRTKLLDKNGHLTPHVDNLSRIPDKVLIASIYKHTGDASLTLKHRMLIMLGRHTLAECMCVICGQPKKMFQFKMRNHCGEDKCIKAIATNGCKERKSYMSFLSEAARKKKSESLKGRVFTEEHKKNISEARKRVCTPEYKEKDRQMRIDRGIYKKMSETIKRKIKNGEYTPTNNRGRATRIVDPATGIAYRSTWEYKFHKSHPHLLFEHTRISYTFDNNEHVYIVDFTDKINNVLYEIKPKSLTTTDNFYAKLHAAEKWCADNNFTYKVVTEQDFNFYEPAAIRDTNTERV